MSRDGPASPMPKPAQRDQQQRRDAAGSSRCRPAPAARRQQQGAGDRALEPIDARRQEAAGDHAERAGQHEAGDDAAPSAPAAGRTAAAAPGWRSSGSPPARRCVQKKNEKHSHTDGSRRKASVCSARRGAAPLRSWAQAPRRSSMASRWSTSSSEHRQRDQRRADVRGAPRAGGRGDAGQEHRRRAQPRLPVMPCTENAWPSRGCETRLLRIVKSTGWNGALPRPASAAASTRPA